MSRVPKLSVASGRWLTHGCLAAALLAAVPAAAQAQQTRPPESAPQNRPDAQKKAEPPGTAPNGVAPKTAPPNGAPKGAEAAPKGGPQAKAGEKKGPPPIAVLQPRTPAEREKALSDLYAHLATAESAEAAKTVSQSIERLWLSSGSDTAHLLMERAHAAAAAKKPELALKMLDAVVEVAPDYAEGWNARAYLHISENRFEQALGDLRRVLALDPNHYKALEGVAQILKEIGEKKGALAAIRKLLEVHPFADGAKQFHDELAREVEGQSL